MASPDPATDVARMRKVDIVHEVRDKSCAVVHVPGTGRAGSVGTPGTSTHPPAEWGAAARNWGPPATDGGAGS